MKKIKKVKECYGEALQDNFVLDILDFKKNGFYIELGSADPIKYNNSYTLEKNYNWRGVSFDLNPYFFEKFKKIRKNDIFLEDAVTYDYKTYLDKHCERNRLDFLQCDIDPTQASYDAMISVLNSGYTFNIIMFEHNIYLDKKHFKIQEDAYKLLSGLGYVRYAKNVKVVSKVMDSSGTWDAFEDWYVHKDLGLPEEAFTNVKFTNIFALTTINKFMEEIKRYSRKLYYYKSKIKQ